jgi:hypothetical protein
MPPGGEVVVFDEIHKYKAIEKISAKTPTSND